MKLKTVSIQNFRGIKSLDLPLDDLTVMIGENNTGKTTILEAIRLALTRGLGTRRGQLTEYDFHLESAGSSPQSAPPVSITLHFAEGQEGEWPDEISQQLDKVLQLDPVSGLNSVTLRVEGAFDGQSQQFVTDWNFLNNQGAPLRLPNTTPLIMLQKFAPLFFLSALRDVAQEFGQRGQFWSGFLKSVEMPDDQRENLESMLRQVNDSVINSNAGFQQVIQQISSAGGLVPLDSNAPVVLEAVPTRIFDSIGKVQVYLRSRTGAKLPLNLHGEGTKSLSVLLLFQAFTAVNLAEAFEPQSVPVLALEEPEAHLHPSAVRSLGSYLSQLTGQVIVSSHSGDLVSRVPVTSIRRLYKRAGETRLGALPSGLLDPREQQAVDYSIRLNRGAYLFSRCWFLVEGESDFHLIPLLAEILGHSPDDANISLIEYSQAYQKGEAFIKVAKALGIEWFLLADGDQAGNGYIQRATSHLEAGEVVTDRALQLSHNDIEHEFWHGGFEDFIKQGITQNDLNQINNNFNIEIAKKEQQTTLSPSDKAAMKSRLFIKGQINWSIQKSGGKPAFAQALASEVRTRGATSIPQTIQDAITRVIQLAGG